MLCRQGGVQGSNQADIAGRAAAVCAGTGNSLQRTRALPPLVEQRRTMVEGNAALLCYVLAMARSAKVFVANTYGRVAAWLGAHTFRTRALQTLPDPA